jgi:hypothetical protein
VDWHRFFDADPDPTYYFEADPDPNPTPSFTHVGKSAFLTFFFYSQQCRFTLLYLFLSASAV